MAGVLGVGFQFLESYPRVALLAVGSFLIFTFGIACVKYRFFHTHRSYCMKQIEDFFGVGAIETENDNAREQIKR